MALEQVGEIDTRALPVADAYHGRLYLVQNGIYLASLETMTITTAISDTLAQPPAPGPNPFATDATVDPGSGRVYAIINNGVPGSNAGTYLYVYEPETYRRVLTDTERSPAYLDLDPTTGRAYVSRIHMSGRSTSLLEDGERYSARLEAVYGAVRVDPGLGRVYLSTAGPDKGNLLVLDANNLDVLGSVPIPGGYTLRSLDPRRHLLYLATWDGHVQIWSATGGELAVPTPLEAAQPPAQDLIRLFRGPGDRPLFAGSLYRSDDEGLSWWSLRNGLPQRGVLQVVASPGFAEDGILFAATLPTDEGLGIWRSENGGQSWQMASRGLTDLAVHSLAISPSFARDQTLFATMRRAGLFRSTDGGETWIGLAERYLPPSEGATTAGSVSVSPTYDRDQTVLVVHAGLWRSQDGGDTWARSFSDVGSLAFSPDFAGDGTVFAWAASGGVLKATDWGDSWRAANAGLAPEGLGDGSVLVSPDYPESRTLYLLWSGSSPLEPGQLFRSLDGAETWQRLDGTLPGAATPFELNEDGSAFLALDEAARLVRWTLEGRDWLDAAPPAVQGLEFQNLVLTPGLPDQTLYAQSEAAGLLRSTDGGQTWSDTGFPVRVSYGLQSPLVTGPASTLFLGTPLGLYRFADGDGWSLVQGGLPSGREVSSPLIVEGSSLVVLAGSERDGHAQSIFLSSDEGRTWRQPLLELPITVTPDELRLSPAFAQDYTAFLAPNWGQAWRSRGGEEWEIIGPDDEQGIAALHVSPDVHQDGLVFVQLQDTSLWRSIDFGDVWTEVKGPWAGDVPMTVSGQSGGSLGALAFSPAFAQDGVLLTQAGDVLYRSVDQGATWAAVLQLGATQAEVTFSPTYGLDGTLYLRWERRFFRSQSRGQEWQELAAGPWASFDDLTLLLPPSLDPDQVIIGWTFDGRVFQSEDGGLSWVDISAGLPATGIRQVSASTEYASDQVLFLVPHVSGLYKRTGEGAWVPVGGDAP
jgi:photosystem II stability/assembly factor-like uncharacterized protein